MNRRYAILSALLRYPDATLRADLPDIRRAIAQAEFSRPTAARLARLARRLAVGDPLDREEAYVRLFDRGRGTSLHLFEHVHGDTRNRGPAMLELAAIYENAGFAMDAPELPDFLPMVLEFCAVAPPEVAANLLTQAGPILDAMHARLVGRASADARAYAAVIAAALEEIGTTPKAAPTAEEERTDAEEMAAMDAAWEAEPVVFGPDSDPDQKGARARVSAMIERLRSMRAAPAR
jgi:nitrate reductase delta subunit